jgi:putative methylase
VRQRDLEIRLEKVPRHPQPRPDLEQYRTPPKIAADVLYRALARGDVAERSVADLGCGTGMFLVGAGLLGASRLAGVDVDAASIGIARATLAAFGLEAELVTGPVEALEGAHDTALMNPPFGAQRAQRHADSAFVRHALHVAPVCYSLHLRETEGHLARLARSLEADLEPLATYEFPLPHQFRFHTKEKLLVPVALYRFERRGHA